MIQNTSIASIQNSIIYITVIAKRNINTDTAMHYHGANESMRNSALKMIVNCLLQNFIYKIY